MTTVLWILVGVTVLQTALLFKLEHEIVVVRNLLHNIAVYTQRTSEK